jgi:uncharacterized protein (DUF1778 family)
VRRAGRPRSDGFCVDVVGTWGYVSPMAATTRKDEVIQIRASAETKALINQAAKIRGQKLSEFILATARREAEQALIDQRIFALDEAALAAFTQLLDNPSSAFAEARRRLSRKPYWQA